MVRRKPLGEADSILHLLTPQGRVDCVVKSGQSSRRWAGLIEPLTLIEGLFAPGRSLESLRECTVLSAFATLKSNLEKLTVAGGWLQLAASLSNVEDSAQLSFRAVVWALVELEKSEHWLGLQHWLLLKLLQSSGCCPSLEVCSVCSDPLLVGENGSVWDIPGRQLLCANCSSQTPLELSVRLDQILLRYLRALSLSPASVHSELVLGQQQCEKINRCLSEQLLHTHHESHEVFRKFPHLANAIP